MNVEGRTTGLRRRRGGGAVVSNLDDVAVVHAGDAVAEMEDAVVVGDDDDRAIGTDGGLAEQLHDLSAGFVVERGGRFVAHEQFRLMHEARAIATRCCWPPESCEGRLWTFLPIPSDRKYLATPSPRPAPCDQPAITSGNRRVFRGGQRRQQVVLLEDEADVLGAKFRFPGVAHRGDVVAEDHDVRRRRSQGCRR